MKKIIQSILILIAAFGSFMAPISSALAQFGPPPPLEKISSITAIQIGTTSASFKIIVENIGSNNIGNSEYIHGLSGIVWNKDPLGDKNGLLVKSVAQSPITYNTASQTVDLVFSTGLSAGTTYWLEVFIDKKLGAQTKKVTQSFVQFKTASSSTSNDGQIIGSSTPSTTTIVQNSFDYSSAQPAQSSEDLIPACGIFNGSIYGCIIQVFYYIFWVPTNWLAALAGKLLDFFVFYSISSSSYNQSGFVNEGWKVVRDVANIAFIFVLLYIALKTILNMGGSQNKKMIVWVIVIALLINFSLFFTKVIVDSGNILAGVLYNNIGAVAQKEGQPAPVAKGEGQEEEISVAIVNQFSPQRLVASAGINSSTVESMKTTYLFIIILATIVNVFMILTFLSVVFLFVGRTIGLMISMIFAPFAFISLTIPGSGDIMKQWAWGKWFKELVSVTFMAPIFIFFLWLILKFLDVGILKGLGEKMTQGGDVLGTFVAIILPMILVLGLLKKAKEVASEMAGEIGNTINSYAGKAIGAVGGVALGGVALAGRGFIGAAAERVAESRTLKQAEVQGGVSGFAARQLRNIGRAGSAASYDLRAAPGADTFQKATGFALGSAGGEGGFNAQVERERKAQLENLERLKMKGSEAFEQDKKADAWKKDYEATKNIAIEESKKTGTAFNESEFKENYKAGLDLKDYGAALAGKTGVPYEESADEKNKEIEKQFIERLKRGTGIKGAIGESMEKAFGKTAGQVAEAGIKTAAVATVLPAAAGLMSQEGERKAQFELEQKAYKGEKAKASIADDMKRTEEAETQVKEDIEKTNILLKKNNEELKSIKDRFAGQNDQEVQTKIDQEVAQKQVDLMPIQRSIDEFKRALGKMDPKTKEYQETAKSLATATVSKLRTERELQDIKNTFKKRGELENSINRHETDLGNMNEKLVRLGETKSKLKDKLKGDEKKGGGGEKPADKGK